MKKEILIPVIVVLLSIVFIVTCVIVYITKGNSYWISKKIKIGALLLALSSTPLISRDTKMCYIKQSPKITIESDQNNAAVYKINLKEVNKIAVKISYIDKNSFTFIIKNEKNKSVQKGNVIVTKEKDEKTRVKGYIILDKKLKSGNYTIYFFNSKKENIDESHYLNFKQILIEND
jgi:hypothetical protein